MKPRRVRSWIAWLMMAALSFPPGLSAQEDKIVALRTSLATNQKLQHQYKWVETTVISMKGEEKSRLQKQVFYGPDGALQKQPLSPPAPQESPGGVKGKIAEKKKAEITAAMQQAADLIHKYVPPDPQRIQAARTAGNLALVPVGPGSARVDVKNYLKSGDSLSLGLDTAGNAMQTISVKSYMESSDDVVTLDVTFAKLRGGLSYPASTVLNVPGENIQVVVQNSNYEKVTPAGTTAAAPAAKPAAGGASMTSIDTLTAPIALYPDALIAQILQASVDFPGVQKFAGWLKANASLKGSALQDAAQAAGFAAWLVALAPFPQVVQMMVDKPDWTQQLGKAFVADKKAVFDSIQHLRAMAEAMGNLKTTEQQAVSTETTSAGQQVIIIEPANPQVIYVPVYTQVVYVQPAPPPSTVNVAGAALVGFTVGVIIGSSHNHYYGGWHAYDEAWDRREDYWDDRQDYAEDRRENTREYQDERRDAGQQNQSQRQSTANSNQSNRQSTSNSSQENRQSTAQTNQSTRQTSGASQETAQANQSNRQSTAQTNSSSRQSTAQSNQGSRQSSGYQSGGSARAQSSRGSASRSGGGRRR